MLFLKSLELIEFQENTSMIWICHASDKLGTSEACQEAILAHTITKQHVFGINVDQINLKTTKLDKEWQLFHSILQNRQKILSASCMFHNKADQYLNKVYLKNTNFSKAISNESQSAWACFNQELSALFLISSSNSKHKSHKMAQRAKIRQNLNSSWTHWTQSGKCC